MLSIYQCMLSAVLYVPSLVKIHWRMLILECSQGCYAVKIWPGELVLWPWKSIGFQILLRTKYVPCLVKIHWRMLILKCSQGCYRRKDGSVTISLRNFVGEGIKTAHPLRPPVFTFGFCKCLFCSLFLSFYIVICVSKNVICFLVLYNRFS